jgi:hypothetical protein
MLGPSGSDRGDLKGPHEEQSQPGGLENNEGIDRLKSHGRGSMKFHQQQLYPDYSSLTV